LPALPKRFCFNKQDVHSLLMVQISCTNITCFGMKKYEKYCQREWRNLCYLSYLCSFRKGVAV
jgi:hypothetical protein